MKAVHTAQRICHDDTPPVCSEHHSEQQPWRASISLVRLQRPLAVFHHPQGLCGASPLCLGAAGASRRRSARGGAAGTAIVLRSLARAVWGRSARACSTSGDPRAAAGAMTARLCVRPVSSVGARAMAEGPRPLEVPARAAVERTIMTSDPCRVTRDHDPRTLSGCIDLLGWIGDPRGLSGSRGYVRSQSAGEQSPGGSLW